jgi:hypothetical protein
MIIKIVSVLSFGYLTTLVLWFRSRSRAPLYVENALMFYIMNIITLLLQIKQPIIKFLTNFTTNSEAMLYLMLTYMWKGNFWFSVIDGLIIIFISMIMSWVIQLYIYIFAEDLCKVYVYSARSNYISHSPADSIHWYAITNNKLIDLTIIANSKLKAKMGFNVGSIHVQIREMVITEKPNLWYIPWYNYGLVGVTGKPLSKIEIQNLISGLGEQYDSITSSCQEFVISVTQRIGFSIIYQPDLKGCVKDILICLPLYILNNWKEILSHAMIE